MATANVTEAPCSSPSPTPQGIFRPTISSMRRCSRAPTVHVGGVALTFRVPSLPKLHRRGPLVSTKLCETRRKSYTGHVFDLSNSQEYYQFLEYNSLHDPHLRSYYHRKAMKEKLFQNGYITSDLHVICHSLKEYNAYRNFLDFEFMKLRKQQEDEIKERDRKHKSDVREQSRTSAMDKEREERRKAFFRQQEKKLRHKQLLLKRREKKEEISKKKVLEERKMQREKNEVKQEAEREKRKLQQLQKEHEEMLRRKSLLKQNEVEDSMRRIYLAKMKQDDRLNHLKEVERRWQLYEEHAQKAKEEEKMRKAEEKEEREKRMRRREKLFQILQQREEERHQRVMEENHQQVEELKQEADKLEKQWHKKKVCEMEEWKEKTQKKIQHWQHHLEHKKEAWRKEHEKHIEELLSHPNAPQLHTSMSRTKKMSADVKKWYQPSPAHNREVKRLTQKGPLSGNNVRFDTTPTVHILEDLLTEEEEEELESEFENPEWESEELEPDLATESVDGIEHTDSYDLQQQRNKEEATIKVVDAEDSLTSLSCDQDSNVKQLEISDGVEQSFNHMQRTLNEEDEPQTGSNDNITETGGEEEASDVDTVNVGKRSASSEGIAADLEGEEGKDSDSLAAEMIVAEQSTASDVVSLAMAKAMERTAAPPV